MIDRLTGTRTPYPVAQDPGVDKRLLGFEVLLLLGVSLGASGVRALLTIADRLTRPESLSAQQATMNESTAPDRPWLDLATQLVGIGLALLPALLALYLLARTNPPAARGIGFDLRRPGFDALGGAGLAALIGVPGLGLYLGAVALGANVDVVPAALAENWWTTPVLILSAIQNSVLEEVIVVGYLLLRLAQLGWHPAIAILASSALRGSYHLYQGFGGFVGNLIMGVIFAVFYRRFGRVGPLVVAHALIDTVAFVGYALLKDHLSWLPG